MARKNDIVINSAIWFSIIGISALLASTGFALALNLLHSSNFIDLIDDAMLLFACLFFGLFVSFFVVRFIKKFQKRTYLYIYICSIAFAIPIFCINLLNIAMSVYLIGVAAALQGIALGLLLFLWGGVWCNLYKLGPKLLLNIGICFAGIIALTIFYVCMIFLASSSTLIKIFAFFLFSSSLILCYLSSGLVSENLPKDSGGNELFLKMQQKEDYALQKNIRSVSFGAFIGLVIAGAYVSRINFLLLFVALLTGIIVLLIVLLATKKIPQSDSIDHSSSFIFVLCGLAILVGNQFPSLLQMISICIMGGVVAFNLLAYYSAVCAGTANSTGSSKNEFNVLFQSLFLGVFFVLMCTTLISRALMPECTILLSAAICLLLSAISHILLPYPDDESIAIFNFINDLEQSTKNNPIVLKENAGTWMKACAKIAQKCLLTPRETEIFELLAKGRNVTYIGEKLVISTNTTKSHIYRIYKKLDINKHQELIDMVENEVELVKQEEL